jgi:hypothetical protein
MLESLFHFPNGVIIAPIPFFRKAAKQSPRIGFCAQGRNIVKDGSLSVPLHLAEHLALQGRQGAELSEALF